MKNRSTIDLSATRGLTSPPASTIPAARSDFSGTAVFDTRVIDASPRLLQESYRLRYQVYCLERHFLGVDDYPHALEIDDFDRHSVHVGAMDRFGRLAGTARLILPTEGMLPTLHQCSFAPIAGALWDGTARWVEVSRLSVSRSYGMTGAGAGDSSQGAYQPRDDRGQVFLAVLKAAYQASRRLGVTHWLVSIERSLQRLAVRNGLPLRQLGPVFDYLGPVAPYSLNLSEFDAVIREGRYPQLTDFVTGLESWDDADAVNQLAAFVRNAPPSVTDQLSLAG